MSDQQTSIATMMMSLGQSARGAAKTLALSDIGQRNLALQSAAAALRANATELITENRIDVAAATAAGQRGPMIDRLTLDSDRINAMAAGLESIVEHPDPVGRVVDAWDRPNGLKIERVTVPLGVISIIYESRPNVTADAAALCIKAGNAAILRGGSESFHSNRAIHRCIVEGLDAASLSADTVQIVPTRSRDAVGYMLSSMAKWVDVVVPRGGKSLVRRVQDEARIPVIGHLEGNCHVYIDRTADKVMARDIVLNAKMRRTGICGAAETVLVDREISENVLPDLCRDLAAAGCEIHGDEDVVAVFPGAIPATEDDWRTEYLDAKVAVRVVDSIEMAIQHIDIYGSGHTESIIASDGDAAARFLREVDSAIVLHNASTQFADGGEFGMGAEIGIATGRVHARGPVGADQLTSYKYVVRGNGQIRP